ncbi:hypothetical protein MMC11_007421 [Xylographa trunciseda]|nr:hypothetical protein [Xylographa trunciseda]
MEEVEGPFYTETMEGFLQMKCNFFASRLPIRSDHGTTFIAYASIQSAPRPDCSHLGAPIHPHPRRPPRYRHLVRSPLNPTFLRPFTCVALPAPSVRSITATVSASFTTNTQQGGLLLVRPPRAGTNPSEAGWRWITATLEYEHGRLDASVVSRRQWADWSVQECDGNGVVGWEPLPFKITLLRLV